MRKTLVALLTIACGAVTFFVVTVFVQWLKATMPDNFVQVLWGIVLLFGAWVIMEGTE